jgi:hypothetical protein
MFSQHIKVSINVFSLFHLNFLSTDISSTFLCQQMYVHFQAEYTEMVNRVILTSETQHHQQMIIHAFHFKRRMFCQMYIVQVKAKLFLSMS